MFDKKAMKGFLFVIQSGSNHKMLSRSYLVVVLLLIF